MSEMIERIARAYCVDDGADPDAQWADTENFFAMKRVENWRRRARISIEAMREPTDAMVWPALDQEGREQVKAFEAGRDDWRPADTGHFDFHRKDDSAGIWRAMIDEALK